MRVSPEFAESVLHYAPPAWVVDRPLDPNALPPEHERASGGVWTLLNDTQHNLEDRVVFHKRISRLATEEGVRTGSRLQIFFSPHIHQLWFHSLVLHRKEKTFDLLASQDVQIFNREAEMEWDMFDGYLTALLLMRDTRVGDIVEYSYSLSTVRTLPHQQNTGRFVVQGGMHSKDAKWRLLYQPERAVYTLTHNHAIKPTVAYTDSGMVACDWTMKDQKPAFIEPALPAWYMPLGVIEYSEYSSWKDVAAWYCHIFYASAELPAEFHEVAANIAARATSPEEQILLALRFVQDEIRYVSISVGEHSHKPYDIATILERRYGDCKDKASVLSALLRALGFEALPALVHSVYRHQVAKSLPSHTAFNHVITRLRHEGRTYWLDATITGQRGALDRIGCPPYGMALVVSPETEALEPVTSSLALHSNLKIIESFKIHQHMPAEFSVTRTYDGAVADQMRRWVSNMNQKGVEQNYLNKYLSLYPGIRVAKPWTVRDNEESNHLELYFDYHVSKLWQPEIVGRTRRYFATFYATGIQHVLQHPPTVERNAPFAIPYPNNIENELNIRSTMTTAMSHNNAKIACEAFNFTKEFKALSNLLSLGMSFKAKSDHVLAKDMRKYSEAITAVAGQTHLRVNMPNPPHEPPPRRR